MYLGACNIELMVYFICNIFVILSYGYKMIKWKGLRRFKWYNTCEGIGLVYHNIDPYARKDKSQKCT